MDQQHPPPNRRSFLACAAASAAWIMAHRGIASGNPGPVGPPSEQYEAGPRILSLELLTAASLAAMKAFYHGALGLHVLAEERERLTIGAGKTRLTFVPAGSADGKPFYHFAFNIPENKILA